MKEIQEDATFYISIEILGQDTKFSADIDASGYYAIKERLVECLKSKSPFDMVVEDYDTLILPYKLLKKSIISLVWNEKE
jgi:hypothetical protein